MSDDDRRAQREAFLRAAGYGPQALVALAPDASFRRYFRIAGSAPPLLLMDAPPGQEDTADFVRVAGHLRGLGLRAPRLGAQDIARGLLLLEDFGEDTYTRLLRAGADQTALYAMAVDVLIELHRHPDAANVALARYDDARLLDEAALLPDWFYRWQHRQPVAPALRQSYLDGWRATLAGLPPLPDTLVLRDFHVDNLMRVRDSGGDRCGLLDFQDALLGSPAYDLVSLLQDARRDLDATLVQAMLARYHAAAAVADPAAFAAHYDILAAQRHCKVAGIFVRLSERDGKHAYLGHLPRVTRLLADTLATPALGWLGDWLDAELPHWRDGCRPGG